MRDCRRFLEAVLTHPVLKNSRLTEAFSELPEDVMSPIHFTDFADFQKLPEVNKS